MIEGDSDTDSSNGCSYYLFSLLSCVVDTVSKVATSVINTLDEDVEDDLANSKNLTEGVQNEDEDPDDETASSLAQMGDLSVSPSNYCTVLRFMMALCL